MRPSTQHCSPAGRPAASDWQAATGKFGRASLPQVRLVGARKACRRKPFGLPPGHSRAAQPRCAIGDIRFRLRDAAVRLPCQLVMSPSERGLARANNKTNTTQTQTPDMDTAQAAKALEALKVAPQLPLAGRLAGWLAGSTTIRAARELNGLAA